jgi:hypothetical protein
MKSYQLIWKIAKKFKFRHVFSLTDLINVFHESIQEYQTERMAELGSLEGERYMRNLMAVSNMTPAQRHAFAATFKPIHVPSDQFRQNEHPTMRGWSTGSDVPNNIPDALVIQVGPKVKNAD